MLGIQENNFAGPNGHKTELKSGRKGSGSMLTLFTKSPLPKGINRELVEKFGKPSDKGKNVLRTTINAVSRNTVNGKPAFLITINKTRVEINHNEYGNMQVPYWNIEDLEASFMRKYPENLLYVKADCKGSGGREEFHFNEAWLMRGFDFENFTNLLASGKIRVDIRLGQYPDGRLHDHGTGFRVIPDNLGLCFTNRERVV